MPQADYILNTLASRYDWESPQGRRVIIYLGLRKLTWKAVLAWQVSRRWVEDTTACELPNRTHGIAISAGPQLTA